MGQLLGPDFPTDIGLAVSGGGDSMAMLALAHNWARVWGVRLWVVTVDHGLRPESANEAAMVAREVRSLGHKHCILKWHWDEQGNVQARARAARLALIDQWRGLLEHVLFAHTADDVAETFLMRLARQAGVEGLSEMQRARVIDLKGGARLTRELYEGDLPQQFESGKGTMIRPARYMLHRPCLDMTRQELRHYARTLQVPWVEDPSNADPRFDRVRMREILPALEAGGLSRAALVGAARHMRRAADALKARAVSIWTQIGREGRSGRWPTGELLLDRTGFEAVERDTQMRLLSYALSYISSQAYRPREEPLEDLLDRLLGGGKGTLHGCAAHMEGDQLRLFREYAALKAQNIVCEPGGRISLWDGRWQMRGAEGTIIRALGEDGWAQINRDRLDAEAPPFASARSLPSLWHEDRLLACDPLGVGQGATRLRPMGNEMMSFAKFLLSH